MTSNYSAPFQKSKYLSLVLDTMDSTEANQIESFSPSEAPQPVDAFQAQTQQLQASDTFFNGTTYSNPSYPSKTSFSSASGLYNTLDVDSCFMSEPGGYTALGLQKRKYEHDSTACDPRPSNRPRIAPDSSALEYVRTDDTSVKEFGLERAGTFESSTTLVDIGFLLNGGGEEICTMSSKVAIEPIDNARHTNEGTKTTDLVSKSQSKITSHKNSTHIITTQPIPNCVSSQIVTLTPGESPRKELEGVNRSDKPETTLLNRTPSLSPTCTSEDEVLSSCRSKSPTVDPPPNPSKTEFNSVTTENYKSISADIQPYTQPTISHQQHNQQSETRFISFEGLDDCDSVQLTASELGDDDVPPSPPPTQPHTPFQSLQHHFIQPPITLSTTQFSPPTSRFLHSRELRILIKNLATPKPVLAFLYSETPGKTTTLQQYINHDPDVIAKRYQHVFGCHA
ncbi:hypothetical protein BCR33DRAFT_521859 [Rhizoclosmatium globosum]|uniref:Uncharacterized protein n=1 Tax=Rhizoclosmatium globosum TaxID=329046 RepID=A0A1Y2BEN1_9FUNG|nr:hypothetical protein BCR33DRAFT_521859 [Rhizoclosmatium globosum]|eukprot:ORY33292.1 hypothetical protein BCR33DRAFT_521859 [Rhizoclosmatium globosum]